MTERRGLLLFVVAIFAILIVLGAFKEEPISFSRSSYNPDPMGTAAVYRLAEDLEIPVARWRSPHAELAHEDGLLVLVAPFGRRLGGRDADEILDWVERGNTLAFFSSIGSPWADVTPFSERSMLERLGFDVEESRVDAPAAGEAFSSEFLAGAFRNESSPLSPSMPSPLVTGLGRLAGGPVAQMKSPQGPWAVLLRTGEGTGPAPGRGPHTWLRVHGRGRILVAAEPGMIENRFVDEADNVELLVRLLELGRGGGVVLFDETVHGHLDRSTQAWSLPWVRRSLVAQLALLGLVYLASRGRRFGPAQETHALRSRSTVELADSMATLYQQGRAGSGVAAQMGARFRRDVAAILGPGVAPPSAVRRLQQRLGKLAADDRPVPDRELLRLDRDVERTLAGLREGRGRTGRTGRRASV